ncbi:hypothetical protein XcuCFBP2542_10140 [Xanthomonas cucurbitae]|uniref:Uncharacterized protein n=1 Tax=Xanthomonas cucurbitae TaxID=56453 RepID=A0A2S7DRH3_9XANT|nr:hypothetical protein XcuCFBP2542_10140 [Xanthomonas cucurbitae]QHG85717.1 hypothetical protein EBN15_00665 [Xanthomonas cucurbitae]
MVNGDNDNCDTARSAVVDAITPLRLGLPANRCSTGCVCAAIEVRLGRGCGRARVRSYGEA